MTLRRLVAWVRSLGLDSSVAMLVLACVLAACSGADTGEPTARVPSPTPVGATNTPVTGATDPTATSAQGQGTTPTAIPTTATAAATSPAATSTSVAATVPAATATRATLPSDGSELEALGEPILGMLQADQTGEVLYAVTASGIVRSDDGGLSWESAGEAPAGRLIAALNNPDVLYSGQEVACARGGGEAPLSRSTDGGQTWEEFDEGFGIRPLLVEAAMQSRVVGTSCMLQISNDGGQTWFAVEEMSGGDAYAAASSDPDSLGDQIVVLSVGEGGTSVAWTLDLSGEDPMLGEELAQFFSLGSVAWSGDRIVLATSTGVGVSDDGGESWTWSRDGLEDVTYSVDPLTDSIPADEQGQSFSFSVVRVDPDDTDRIWVGGPQGVFASTDGGATWTHVGETVDVESLVVSTVTDRVFISDGTSTTVWDASE